MSGGCRQGAGIKPATHYLNLTLSLFAPFIKRIEK